MDLDSKKKLIGVTIEEEEVLIGKRAASCQVTIAIEGSTAETNRSTAIIEPTMETFLNEVAGEQVGSYLKTMFAELNYASTSTSRIQIRLSVAKIYRNRESLGQETISIGIRGSSIF